MAKSLLNFDKVLDETWRNVQSDRNKTGDLLAEALDSINGIKNPGEKAQYLVEIGPILAKYIEAFQRSNEQLVKLAGILKKDKPLDENPEDDMNRILETLSKEARANKTKEKEPVG